MYTVFVMEDGRWKFESIHSSADEAEFQRIQMSYQDDRDRDVRRLPVEL